MDISESYDPQSTQPPSQQPVAQQAFIGPQQQPEQNNSQTSMFTQTYQPANGMHFDSSNSDMEQMHRPADIDIDSCLLQQFSCMGTTDHDDLINQFQNFTNHQINKETARFFLEMSNWNLQTAICCYFDFRSCQTLPSMKVIEQGRPSELKQMWKLQNDGTELWPYGCFLMSPNQVKRIQLPSMKPGDTCDIIAEIPPTSPAIMWRLCTPNGWYFGETIWMIPAGSSDTAVDLAARMSQLRTSTPMNPESFPQINVVIMRSTDNNALVSIDM